MLLLEFSSLADNPYSLILNCCDLGDYLHSRVTPKPGAFFCEFPRQLDLWIIAGLAYFPLFNTLGKSEIQDRFSHCRVVVKHWNKTADLVVCMPDS